VRWGGGALLIYALADAIHAAIAGIYRLAGRQIPSQHRTPAAARSVREFWGSRWNRTVSRWLDRSVFRAWARRGQPRVGWALAFLVSSAVHAYFVLVAAGPRMALWMGIYFLLQGLLVLAELRLHVDRWPAMAAHGWVITVMLLSAPLFTEPFLQVLGLTG
jgi:D-alanyl-lipoteichoic acid acyltransferase DltB (MBOAT superfamily)